jgi:hypothetical protein
MHSLFGFLVALVAACVQDAPTHRTLPRIEAESHLAPAGTWPRRGGSPGRTRATATAVVRATDLELALAVDLEAPLVGEPLFDPRHLLVELAVGAGRRRLVAYELATGREFGRREFTSSAGLAPDFTNGIVTLRASDKELLVLRPQRRGLSLVSRIDAPEGDFGEPFVLGSTLFVTSGSSLFRYDAASREPSMRWQSPLDDGEWFGSLFVSDDNPIGFKVAGLHGSRRSERARFASVFFNREGRGVFSDYSRVTFDTKLETGLPIALRSRLDRTIQGSMYGPRILAWFDEQGYALPDGTTTRSLACDGDVKAIEGPLYLVHEPASNGPWTFARLNAPNLGEVAMVFDRGGFAKGDVDALILAGRPEYRPEVVSASTRAVWAEDVLLVAGRAWHPQSRQVLWHEPQLEGLDLYPLDGGVLAVRSPTRLEIWRPVDPARDVRFENAVAAEEPGRGLALFADGTTLRGTFAIEGTELVDRSSRTGRRVPLADVEFACHEDGRLVVASGPSSIEAGLDELLDERARDEFRECLAAARRSNDAGTLRSVLALAIEIGEDATDLIDELAQPPAKKRALVERDVVRAMAFVDAHERRRVALRETAALSLEPHEGTNTLHAAAVRLVLERDPRSEFARQTLARSLPAGLTVADDADLFDWLDFAVAVSAHHVDVVPLPDANAAELTPTQERVRALAGTRAGVLGFESEHLLIVSAIDRPGAIARCVALGEHVCALLESWFAGGTPVRASGRKLEIVLHGTREEYLAASGAGDPAAAHVLAWSAGHFDIAARLSRLFLPDGEEAWDDAARTLLHELTHHWMHVACPLVPDDALVMVSTPGFWVVEGFASLVEDHVVDALRGVTAPIDPRSLRLDVVAHAAPDALIPWSDLVELPQSALVGLASVPRQSVPRAWVLGNVATAGGVELFYAQSAALTSHLFHGDGGSLRARLLEHVVEYHSGGTRTIDFAAHFGRSAADLASSVVAHATAAIAPR